MLFIRALIEVVMHKRGGFGIPEFVAIVPTMATREVQGWGLWAVVLGAGMNVGGWWSH